MEKNGLEIQPNEPHSIWFYLPTEIWFQIFRWLRVTRYIALIGALSKGFRVFMIEYFKATTSWMDKNMNVAIIGALDVGKTTMLARLLLQLGQNNIENKFTHFHRERQNLKDSLYFQAGWRYNTFLNSQHGKPTEHTQDIYPFYVNTSIHNFTIFDTPGCDRRLISAYRLCSQVNTVILVIQKDFGWLINEVTAVLTSLTHSHFIIAINYEKDGFTQPVWEADRKLVYDRLVKAVPPKLISNVKLIPIDAFKGFNIYSPHVGIDDSNVWYTGPTLFRGLHAIWEKLEYNEKREQMPFSMTIIRKTPIRGCGPVLIGTVNSGCVKLDMKVKLCCSGAPRQPLVIKSIQHNRVNMTEAKPDDHIGISFSSGSLTAMREAGFDILKRAKYGMIIADAKNPPKRVKSFVAAIAITSKAGFLNEGTQYKTIYQGSHIFVVLKTILQVLDKEHKDVTLTRKRIFGGDTCLALCVPTQEMWTYPKVAKTKQKDSRDVILFTSMRQILAAARIDTITFFDDDEVNQQPHQFAHYRQPELK